MLIASLVVLQILIFAALIFFFRKVMTQNVTMATKHLDELSQDYTKKEKDVERILQEANIKAQEILSKAQEEASQLKVDIIKHAEEERDKIVGNARGQGEEIIKQADKSRLQLIAEIDQRIEKGAILKACELIGQTLPEEFKRQVHGRWVEDLLAAEMAQLSSMHIPAELKTVVVTSAFNLTDEQRRQLAKKIKDSLRRELEIKEETDSRLVAGLVLSFGSLVLDGSLKNKIEEQAKRSKV